MHQFFKHPLEVGEGIGPMAADLLDEGVEDCAAPTGVFATDEHPVLVPEFGGADRIFGEVVVELDLSVEETRLEVWPLAMAYASACPILLRGVIPPKRLSLRNSTPNRL